MLIIQRPRTLLFPYPYFLESAFWDAPEERFNPYRQWPPEISDLPDFESSVDFALSLFGRSLGYNARDDLGLYRGSEAELEGHSLPLEGSDKTANGHEEDNVQRKAQAEHDEQDLVPETPLPRKDKGKARATIQEESFPPVYHKEPQSTGYDPQFWDQFGGIGALEEEDAIVRQLQHFGETAYPGYVQPGVAGPSGTRHEDHTAFVNDTALAESAAMVTVATAIPKGPKGDLAQWGSTSGGAAGNSTFSADQYNGI